MDSYVYIGVSIYRYVCVGMYICVHIRHAMSIWIKQKIRKARRKERGRGRKKKKKMKGGEVEKRNKTLIFLILT